MAWGRLALIQSADDAEALDKIADVFGYARKPDKPVDVQVLGRGFTTELITSSTDETDNTAPKRPPARFLRINKIITTETNRNDFQKPSYLSESDMRLQASEGTYYFAAPSPLMPIARLLPLLFNSLAQARTGHSLDHKLLLRRIEQGKALQSLPKRQRQRWPQRLQIIVDASKRLEPYWADFEFIVRQLQTLLGKEAVEALRFDENTLGSEACYCLPWPATYYDQWRIWQAPPPDVAILILSDLGVGDSRAAVGWQRQLACLQQHPGPILSLSPASCSPSGQPFCRQLKPNPFNDHYLLPRHPVRTGFAISEPSMEMIDNILTWLAPLPLIDTGLLRRLRIEMQWGDSALEEVIWNHSSVRNIGLGICLQQHIAEDYQQRFHQKYAGSDTAKRFWAIVEQHHAKAYQGLRQLEKFKLSLFEKQDEPAMREYFHRLCATGMQSGNDPAQQHDLRLQCRTVLASLPDAIWNSELKELAYSIYATAHEDEIRAGQWPEQLTPGFNPDRLQWVIPSTAHEKLWWQVIQIGDQGQIKCEPCTLENDVVVSTFKTEVSKEFPPRLTLSNAKGQVTHMLQNGITVTLSENEKAIFESRGLKLELEAILRPSWASRIWRNAEGLWSSILWLNQELEVFWQVSKTEANGSWCWPLPFGEDAFGLYVDLSVKHAVQRFRWIEPGSFWMGSPEEKPQREWNGSETLHHVTLTQGFWLADTTVSQVFWRALMGNNPSLFTDNRDNPAEQISWQDAQAFIDKLNNLFPGLSAKLPSEAQWEYSCRAGTDTSFSFGANITPEQANYDGNFPYAEGGTGLFRQQTVPVKSLPANSWGLYEMHGNIWEWCADAWQQQMPAEPVTDPLNTGSESDSARVVRGGSWNDVGGSVRSAYRYRNTPDYRGNDLGFRLSLGQAELRPGQGGRTPKPDFANGGGTGRLAAEQRQTVPPPGADNAPESTMLKRAKMLFGNGGQKKT